MSQAEPLSIEQRSGILPGSRILHCEGPLTLPNVFQFQDALRNDDSSVTILDLSGVPYMDSAGMGSIINFYVSCQKNGRRLIVAGVSDRILELFKLTRVDSLLTIVPTLADAGRLLA